MQDTSEPKRFITASDCPDQIQLITAGSITEFVIRADQALQDTSTQGAVWINAPASTYDRDIRRQFLSVDYNRIIEDHRTNDPFYSGQEGLYAVLDAGQHRKCYFEVQATSPNSENEIRVRTNDYDFEPLAIAASLMERSYDPKRDRNAEQPQDFQVPTDLATEISELTRIFTTTETQIRFERNNGSFMHYDGKGDVEIEDEDVVLSPESYLFNGVSVRMIGTLPIPGIPEDNTPTTQVLFPDSMMPNFRIKAGSPKIEGLDIWNLKPNQWMIFKNQDCSEEGALFHGPDNFAVDDFNKARIFVDHSFGLSRVTRTEAHNMLEHLDRN